MSRLDRVVGKGLVPRYLWCCGTRHVECPEALDGSHSHAAALPVQREPVALRRLGVCPSVTANADGPISYNLSVRARTSATRHAEPLSYKSGLAWLSGPISFSARAGLEG